MAEEAPSGLRSSFSKRGEFAFLPQDPTAGLRTEVVAGPPSLRGSVGATEPAVDTPPSPSEAAAAERASLFCSRMRSRHLDLLKTLSAKNREKEDQQKKEETRLAKRGSILRERVLGSYPADLRAGGAPALPAAGPVAAAPEEEAEEQRLHAHRCNVDIAKRQEEALQRLASQQQTEKVKKEREQLKKEWRLHRAKGYLLNSCRNNDVREYLESKGKPRALPKLPVQNALGGSGDQLNNVGFMIRGFNAESVSLEDDDPELQPRPEEGALAVCPSPEIELIEEPSVPSAPKGYERNCSSPTRNYMPASAAQQTQLSINRFLERTQHSRAAAHCADIAEWRRRNGCEPDRQVFICNGGYPDFKDALLKRGWFQNMDKDSRHFDLKWGMAGDIDHNRLKPNQIVNHFDRCRDLTTKIGLSLNLRNSIWHSGVDQEEYYPRAYDLSDPGERADFVLSFKFTKAESVLRQFIDHMGKDNAEMTFSQEVVDVASKMCLRQLTDVDDVLDCPELAENLGNVKACEWDLLKEVCLEDVSKRLEAVTKDQDLQEMIMTRNTIAEIQKKRVMLDEKEKKEKEREAELRKGSKAKKKKKKGENQEDEEIPLSAPTASFSSTRGQYLCNQAKSIVKELEFKTMQHAMHGNRNAWIIKPAGKSRGRGIQVMRELDEIFKATESDGYQWVSQKYIEQPQLIHGYKFDIRQWVLVTDWNPLTIYIWQQPYLRFAGQKYDDSLSSLSEYMHLVNNSIIKNMADFQEVNTDLNASGYMWFRQQYEGWLHDTYCKCKRHSTPWKKAAPYTCETFGVKWEDVAFTAKEEEEEDDDEPSGNETAVKPPSSDPASSSTAAPASDAAEAEETSPADLEDLASPRSPEPCGSDGPKSPVGEASLQACPCGRHFPPGSKFCKGCGNSRAAAEAELLQASLHSEEARPKGEEDDLDDGVPSDDLGECAECENLWESCIMPQINDIITRSLLCVVDNIGHRKNSHELYGYDFMLSEGPDGRPKVWLIEVNSSPACDYSTPVTTPLVKKMMEDTVKVMVDKKTDPEVDTGEWVLLTHPYTQKVKERVAGCNLDKDKLEVCGSQIKPSKKSAQKKKKQKGKGSKSKSAGGAGCSDALDAAADEDADADADEDEEP